MSEKHKIDYSRAITGLSMARGEAYKLVDYLTKRSLALRAEADEIDRMLETATEHSDLWYEALEGEDHEFRKRLKG